MTNAHTFWKTTPLSEMGQEQWETLCDGCGRCCLLKLEDIDEPEGDPGRLLYTSVACKLLNCSTGRCGNYADRLAHVPDCLVLTPASLSEQKDWMPETCAYRRLAEGRDIPNWHPLITGKQDSVVDAGVNVGGRVISELDIVSDDDLVNYIIPPFHIRQGEGSS